MKTDLRLAPHRLTPDASIFELWYGPDLIGQVVGRNTDENGPGVRVLSKYPMVVATDLHPIVNVVEVAIAAGGAPATHDAALARTTADDEQRLEAILRAERARDPDGARLIFDYYTDLARVARTPARWIALHIGVLAGKLDAAAAPR